MSALQGVRMLFRLAWRETCGIGQNVTLSPGAIRRLPVVFLLMTSCSNPGHETPHFPTPIAVHSERQLTRGPGGRILSNTGVWSPDSQWIVYDTRPDSEGAVFSGKTIDMVNVATGEVKEVYQSSNDACCGVVTFHPRQWKVAFILGPEHPTAEWQYCAWHRQGVIVAVNQPGVQVNLDARDILPPFTPGALRGGSHVHVWDAAGEWVSFTYEDHVLSRFNAATPTNDINQRNVGVSVPGTPVRVSHAHPRNHDGDYFSVVGTNGYVRRDGSRQRRALAFQGQVLSPKGETMSEVFIADLPDDLTQPGDGPLCGTENRAPYPPKGTVQRRLTFTAGRRYPGIQGPRHWLRSSPDGSQIAFLMKDDAGVVQLWTVSPRDGSLRQVTKNPWPVASAFTWSPDARQIAHVADNSVCVTDMTSGDTRRLTPRTEDSSAPRPEACVFSPDGARIAFVRRLPSPTQPANQICVVALRP